MTGRRTPEPRARAKLRAPADEAARALEERIRLGREIDRHINPGAYVSGAGSKAEAALNKWHQVNYEVLRSLFDHDEVADRYYRARTIWRSSRDDDDGLQLQRVQDNLARLVGQLEAVLETLPTYEQASAESRIDEPAQESRPSNVNITMLGGVVGQLNLGQVQGNINTHVNALADPSAEAFRDAVKQLAEAIAKDRGLKDDVRVQILEDIDYIAEEAGKDASKRRPTLLKRTIEGLQLAVATAEQAKTAWDTFGPIISGFLPH